MSKNSSDTGERPSVRWGFRIGLREQMAVLGISGVLVTGVICAAALHYASIVQREASASNELKACVVSLSQSFLESGQIATEFVRKPTEMRVKTHADLLDRHLEDLRRVEKLTGELADDDPLRQAASLRQVINLYATRFGNVVSAQRNLGFNEDDGFQGKSRTAVHAVEEPLSQMKQPRLTILMLMMRRNEKDFILQAKKNTAISFPAGRWSSKPNLLRQACLPRRNPSSSS